MFSVCCNCGSNSERNQKRPTKTKLFIKKYNWNGIKYPSKIEDQKAFEKNNFAIALDIFYIKEKEKEIYPAYISKHISTSEKQIILLMIPNDKKEGWNYLEVKKTICIVE